MAIDHRILQQIGVNSISPVLSTFNNALNQSQERDIRGQQAEQQAALQPFRQQLLEQQIAQGQQQASQGRQQQILKSVNDFALTNKSLIQNAQSTGDFTGLLGAMSQRREQLIQQGLPTETTDEGIALINAGQGNQVISALGDSVDLFNQQSGKSTGTASQRDFQTFQELNLKAQETGDAGDILAAKQFGIQSGFGRPTADQLQEQAISKAQELADIEVEKSAKIEQAKSNLQGTAAAKKLAVNKSGKAFDKLANIDVALSNFDDAIKAIDEGAQTGTIISNLPSFRKSSIELDNIQKALGLDVVGNTTFGALSESELKFALDKALPKNLQPQDLKTWLQAKKSAQSKLRDHISNAAQFLGTGENTIPDWLELQKAQAVIREQESTAAPIATQIPVAPTQKDEGVIMTDANGNRARVFADGTFEEL